MTKAKELSSLDLRKTIGNAHCKGEGNTKLSKRIPMSRTVVKRIIKNVKESSEIQSLPGRLRRTKIPKTLRSNT